MMQGQSAQQLQQHAQRAFQASETLLRQASQGNESSNRFYTAANRYATTLRAIGGTMSGRSGAGSGGSGGSGGGAGTGAGATGAGTSGSGTEGTSGSGGSSATAGSGGGSMMGTDQASVALINHAVKEALDSMQLKQMIRTSGSQDSTAARVLLAHAREMDSESRQALQMFGVSGPGCRWFGAGGVQWFGCRRTRCRWFGAGGRCWAPAAGRRRSGAGGQGAGGSGAGGRAPVVGAAARCRAGAASGASVGQGGTIQMLAQQAHEVVQAIQEISGGDAQGSGREGAGSGSGLEVRRWGPINPGHRRMYRKFGGAEWIRCPLSHSQVRDRLCTDGEYSSCETRTILLMDDQSILPLPR